MRELMGQQVNKYLGKLDELSIYVLGLLSNLFSKQDHVGSGVQYAEEYLLRSIVVLQVQQ